MTKEYDYAQHIAVCLWEKHYKKKAPDWEPLEDLMGVLSQIDNMTVGLIKPLEQINAGDNEVAILQCGKCGTLHDTLKGLYKCCA